MKQKIIDILNNRSSEIKQSEFTQWGVIEENFKPVAEEIAGLFNVVSILQKENAELKQQIEQMGSAGFDE